MSGGHRYDLHDAVQAQKYERAKNYGPVNGFGGDRQILWRPFATAYPGQVGLVQLGGLEPPTSCSTDRRSNQLSYNCILGRQPSKKAAPNGPETRCNIGLWQGR